MYDTREQTYIETHMYTGITAQAILNARPLKITFHFDGRDTKSRSNYKTNRETACNEASMDRFIWHRVDGSNHVIFQPFTSYTHTHTDQKVFDPSLEAHANQRNTRCFVIPSFAN